MNVRILTDDTYALYDGETQVEQGPITEAMRAEAKRRKQGLRTYIAAMKKVKVETILAVPVEGETVIKVPDHDHPYDDRYAHADHPHPFMEHEHEPHEHDEWETLSRSITEHDLSHTENVNDLKGQFLRHTHEGYVGPDHPHHDIQADINLLNVRMRVQEEHQHALTLPPDYNSLKTEVRDLREEVVVLRSLLSSFKAELAQTRAADMDTLRLEMKAIERAPHTHDQYLPAVKFEEYKEAISTIKTFRVVSNDKDETGQKITKMVEVG